MNVVSTALKIKEAADASGFTPATLRYYEDIGLLPQTTRTASGYRTYDQHTLDRLRFIARAKQLGCTLEEILDLTVAWDGGQCGPLQDRLRVLVHEKIAASQAQLAELVTFTAELQQAAVALERHRPEGACDANCGCVDQVTTPTSVNLTTKPANVGDPVIACTLEPGSMKGRLEDWQRLLTHAHHREPIADGVRTVFAATVSTDELIRLVTAEQDCCQFFKFAITVDNRGTALEVRAPGDALPLVESIFGVGS